MIDLVFVVAEFAVVVFATLSGVAMFIFDIVQERKNPDWKTTGFVNTVVLLCGVLMLLYGVESVYELTVLAA